MGTSYHSSIDLPSTIIMKLFIVAALISVAAGGALPQAYQYPAPGQYQPAPGYRARSAAEGRAAILRSDAQLNERDFHYAFETENGIQAQESGHEADGIQAQGGYSYVGDDGQVYSIQYTAGAGGFQVQGNHLPTPPPVPEEIARALQQNARDEASGIYDDGSYHDGKYSNDASGSGVFAARSYNQPQPAFRGSGYRY